ncbi:MAG: NUDIX hydrolase [Nanoarchaeota archaeon]|nr:NUDIX hydrolase [Nanoarchaeota archaeon]
MKGTDDKQGGYRREGYINPIPTTDLVIEYALGQKYGIVLIERKNAPKGIALPGGFAEHGISLEDNAVKEAKEETNLDVILESPERPFCVHSRPDRDPRDHMISVTYIAQGSGSLKAGDDAKAAGLYDMSEVKGLLGTGKIVFDHERIIAKYLVHRGHATEEEVAEYLRAA